MQAQARARADDAPSVEQRFYSGTILGVGIDISKESHLNREQEAAAALARD